NPTVAQESGGTSPPLERRKADGGSKIQRHAEEEPPSERIVGAAAAVVVTNRGPRCRERVGARARWVLVEQILDSHVDPIPVGERVTAGQRKQLVRRHGVVDTSDRARCRRTGTGLELGPVL